MRAGLVVLGVTLWCAPGPRAFAQTGVGDSDVPALGGGRVALQIAAGVPASLVGFVVGGLASRKIARSFSDDEPRVTRIAYAGGFAGAALATGGTAAWLGSRPMRMPDALPGAPKINVHGSYGAAVGGAVVGTLGSALLRKAGRAGHFGERGPLAIIAGAAIAVLPSVGAAIAYNSTRGR